MVNLETFLKGFLLRYRRRFLLQAGLRLIIGCVAIGLFAYKLSQFQVPAILSIGLPVLLGISGLFFLCRWISHRWISRNAAPAYLDRTLKLQQRLVTVAEFAKDKKQSSLYHLLVEDTTHNLSDDQGHMPRPFDKTAALLALALLLVWLWPADSSEQLQIAQKTEDPSFPDQRKQDTSDQRDQNSESAPQSQGSDSSNDQQSGGQSGADDQMGEDDSPQDKESQGSDPTSSEGSQGNQEDSQQQDSTANGKMANQSGQNNQQQRANKDSSSARSGSSSADQSQQQQAEEKNSRDGQSRAQANQQSASSQDKDQSRQKTSASDSRSERSRQSSSTRDQGSQSMQTAQRSGKQPSQGSQQNSGLSAAQQQAMRAEIKELLKELSAEMEAFHKQLAEAPEAAYPEAGTSTDPDLYERAMEIERKIQAQALPMTLATDDKESGSMRKASGIGESSEEVSDAAPQMSRDNARLSGESAPVQAVERQPIPPVYQGVFENLEKQ